MQTYVGTKIIAAREMTRAQFCDYIGRSIDPNTDGADEGYLVEYMDGGTPNHQAHKGFISWSPKDVFEGAYLSVGDVGGLEDWQVRVIAEKVQLDDKLELLNAFTQSSKFALLPTSAKGLLFLQRDAMAGYSQALGYRIAAFGDE